MTSWSFLKIWSLLYLISFSIISYAELPTPETHLYGRVGSVELKGDMYMPPFQLNNRPVVIWVHGGGLIGGSRQGVGCTPSPPSTLISDLLSNGYAVFMIDYRLTRIVNPSQPCPTHDPMSVEAVWPAHIQDVRTAIRWVRSQAESLSVNPNAIIVAGESGGGQLSLLATLAPESAFPKSGDLSSDAARESSIVQAGLDWFGITNPITWHQYFKRTIPALASTVEAIYGGSPTSSPKVQALYQSAAAVNYIRKGIPPLLVVHGTCDLAVPFSQSADELARAFHRAGMVLDLVPITGMNHGLERSCLLKPRPDKFDRAKRESIDFLNDLFAPL